MKRISFLGHARSAALLLALITSALTLSCSTLGTDLHEGRAFASPEAAGEALVAALRSGDDGAAEAILGRGSEELISSGDPVMDRNQNARFVALYDARHRWIDWAPGVSVLEAGENAWPFPIPLVESKGNWWGRKGGWRFDTPEGAAEILNRRIGRNELNTIQACLAFVDAQRDYYARNPQQSAAPSYARFILSSEGKKDGLYWPTAADEAPSPLGPLYAAARNEGYTPAQGAGKPFEGYFYRVLDAQGASAPGGAYGYTEDGAMTLGFGMVASPAKYGASGVMSFLVNQLGLVYQKDLGPETEKLAMSMKSFDPDDSWALVPANALALPDD